MALNLNKANRLSFKLVLTLTILSLVYSAALIGLYLASQLPQAVNELHGDVNRILDTFKQPATQAVFNVDKESAHNVLAGLTQYPYIIEATIVSDDNSLLAHIEFDNIQKHTHNMLTKLLTLPQFNIFSRELHDDRFDADSYGQLLVKVDQHRALDPLFEQLIILGKNNLLQYLLFIFFVYFIVYQLITKRIIAITTSLGEIPPNAPNNKRIFIPKGDDEIIQLAKGINQFIDSTEHYLMAKNEAEKSLLELAQHLEKLVDHRTADLENTKNKAEKARDEADRANKTKSVFLANMSHELRTPLNSIIGFTRRILKKSTTSTLSERERDGLERVYDNGQYLLSLINDLLDIAKIEANKMQLARKEVRLDLIIADCCNKLETLAEQASLALVNTIDTPITLQGDPQKLQQIFMNIISNGIKYSEQGSVTITLSSINAEIVSIAVRDTGIGIHKKDFEKLFDPYNHIHSNTSKTVSVESTGLGLPLAHKLTLLHHGKIDVDSEPSKGSIFTVTLPRD